MGLSPLLVAYAGGLLLAPYLLPVPWVPLLVLASGGLWLLLRRQRPAICLLLLFFCCLGLGRYQLRLAPATTSDHLGAWTGAAPRRVEGRVIRVRDLPEGRGQLDLDRCLVYENGHRHAVSGGLRLYLDGPPGAITPGCRLRLRAPLRAPRDFGTPGEFAYRRHLLEQGIEATAHLAASSECAVLGDFAPGPGAWIQHLRQRAGQFIDHRLPAEQAALLRALLLGDQGGLDAALRDRLSACGLSHLFAISGMHLGFIAGFLYLFALAGYRRSRRLLLFAPPRRVLPLALLPLIFLYLLFSGTALATSRAFLVAAGAAVALALSRTLRPFDALLAAAMALLLWDPLTLFEPSLQLSVAGAAGLLLLLPRWLPRLRQWPRLLRWPATLLLASLAATLATLPLSLWHFHRLAPAAPLTNLWAVPLVAGGALPLGLTSLLLAPAAPAPGGFLLQLAGVVVHLALTGAEMLTAWPPLSGRFWYPGPLQLAALALAVGAVAALSAGHRRRGGAMLLAGMLLAAAGRPPAHGPLTVTALSVGQGESLLLTLPGGDHILIDGGGSRNPHFDVGRRLVAPALGRLGVTALRAVLLTHPHPDHYGGLAAVLAGFPVAELWVGADPGSLPPALATQARQRQIPVRAFASGWHPLNLDAGAELDLYAPPTGSAGSNDRSLVIYARQGTCGALLTGDLEAAGVRRLLQQPLPGPVGLLKIPHHGSRHSAPKLLLDSLQPAVALVSAGAGNTYGFPAPTVTRACRQRGIRLWRTDREGSLRFLAGPREWRSEHWQRGLFR